MIAFALLFSGLHSFLVVIQLILDEYSFKYLPTVASAELTNPIYFSPEQLVTITNQLVSSNHLAVMMDMKLYMLLANRMSSMVVWEDPLLFWSWPFLIRFQNWTIDNCYSIILWNHQKQIVKCLLWLNCYCFRY